MPDRDVNPGQSEKSDCSFFVLSDRQRQVLALAALGLTDREIARRLALSSRTVRHYLATARELLGAANTTHAVALALVSKMIQLPQEAILGCPPMGGGEGG
jgi:DNA-binding CsgD family transcriptional regulator